MRLIFNILGFNKCFNFSILNISSVQTYLPNITT